MKKILNVLALVLILSCVLTACNITYEVTFDSQGGSTVAAQTVVSGKRAIEPKNPVKAGNEFAGWSEYKDTFIKFDFDSAITQNTTIYAFWYDLLAKDTFNKAIDKMSQQNYMNIIYGTSRFARVFEKGELVSKYSSIDREEWQTQDGFFVKEAGIVEQIDAPALNSVIFNKNVFFDYFDSFDILGTTTLAENLSSISYNFWDTNEIIIVFYEGFPILEIVLENELIKKVSFDTMRYPGGLVIHEINFTYVKNSRYYPPSN